MAWSEEQVREFQNKNNMELKEINATLRPDPGIKTGKIGIFLFGQAGDLATAMSVLKYRNELWKDKEIIWFANYPNADLLRFAPISEVRPWPWAGNGLPLGTPDFYPLLCNDNNRLNLELAGKYELTKDLEDGYFPAPHMLSIEKRHGINYPNVSKMVFGIDMSKKWYPLLSFSDAERETAKMFISELPPGKIIIFETFAGSGQSQLNHKMVMDSIKMCQTHGDCNFIFVSHKYLNKQYNFPDGFFNNRIVSASHFTHRQCALLANYCDLYISVSSGISVTSSCWDSKNFPILQYCGSEICGQKELFNGHIETVYSDYRPIEDSESEFFDKLSFLLKNYL